MVKTDINDEILAEFFEAAKTDEAIEPSSDLMTRVLGDAAEIGLAYAVPVVAEREKQSFLTRLFAPIGGLGGAFALGSCACVGLFIGLGNTETLYSLPVMGDILATFTDNFSDVTTFGTLDYLMAES